MTPRSLATIPVRVGPHRLEVEVADTPLALAIGLMFRRHLPSDRGMLFAFEDEQVASFWMKNTYLPLSIAFLDRDKRVLNVEDLEPLDETSRRSAGPARYAIEANRGWFAERGIGPGSTFHFDLPERG